MWFKVAHFICFHGRFQPKPQILTFDHIYPPPELILERPPRTAIFYASLTSANFRELHTYLLKLTNRLDPHVEYVFRHIPPTAESEGKNYLSGYGVGLDLKKMDYLALDDRNTNSAGKYRQRIDYLCFNNAVFCRQQRGVKV